MKTIGVPGRLDFCRYRFAAEKTGDRGCYDLILLICGCIRGWVEHYRETEADTICKKLLTYYHFDIIIMILRKNREKREGKTWVSHTKNSILRNML